jgi:hypothetical protein
MPRLLRAFLPVATVLLIHAAVRNVEAQCEGCGGSQYCQSSYFRAYCKVRCSGEWCSCSDGSCRRQVEPSPVGAELGEAIGRVAWRGLPATIRIVDCDGSSEVFAIFAGAAGVTVAWVPGMGRGPVPAEPRLEGVPQAGATGGG